MESKINNILNKPITVRERTDELLFLDAQLHANLGTDSTDIERALTATQSKLIYEAIETIDPEMGQGFIRMLL